MPSRRDRTWAGPVIRADRPETRRRVSSGSVFPVSAPISISSGYPAPEASGVRSSWPAPG
ncbi:hypothetical protein [Streptomyces sp. NPDC059224]|uniref:hypothetical protein n=1 Tax=Streptomyces sp. NPDC059224 TaxID=3346775 RepID=UPI00368293FE